jgi:hypothetical protein
MGMFFFEALMTQRARAARIMCGPGSAFGWVGARVRTHSSACASANANAHGYYIYHAIGKHYFSDGPAENLAIPTG